MNTTRETTAPGGLEQRLVARARALAGTVLQHRRALHEIPELAFHEFETARYIERALAGLGLAARTGVAGTGLVVELPGGGPGPAVLVRADMDGLPLHEDPSLALRSKMPGRMHACGHDGHMAIVLGVAHTLAGAGTVEALPGRVVLLFQPGEEHGAGAQKVLEQGLLDEYAIDTVLGLHLWSYLPRGVAVIPGGPVMASADEFQVVLKGHGGHGALPHKASDLVLAASTLVVSLQQIVARNVDPLRPAVVSVGRLRAGDAANVLPDSAEIFGTFRAADPETRGMIMHRIGELADCVARAHGATAEIDFGIGYPATINDAGVAEVVRGAARDVLGADAVRSGPMTMAGEDFAFLLQARPGVMFLLGMRDEERGLVHPHHSPMFQVAEDVLPLGLEIVLRAAVRLMEAGPRRAGAVTGTGSP